MKTHATRKEKNNMLLCCLNNGLQTHTACTHTRARVAVEPIHSTAAHTMQNSPLLSLCVSFARSCVLVLAEFLTTMSSVAQVFVN